MIFSGFKLFAKVSLGFNQYIFSDRASLHLGYSDMPRWVQLFSFVHHSLLINNDNCCRANSDNTASRRWLWFFFFMARSNYCVIESGFIWIYLLSIFSWYIIFSFSYCKKNLLCHQKRIHLNFFAIDFTSDSWVSPHAHGLVPVNDLHCTYANTEKEHLASSRNQSRWLNKWCYSNFNKL